MKIASYTTEHGISFGIVKDGHVLDVNAELRGEGIKSVLASPDFAKRLDRASGSFKEIPLDKISYLPPVPQPDKIFCVGLNYAGHIKENNLETPKFPWIFMRTPSAQVGHEQAILRPKVSEQYDYEGEFAVVIGRQARHVSVENALDHVAGYTCFNEASVRDWQLRTSQYCVGKNFYRSGSIGPWMVTADEMTDLDSPILETRLNGTVVQRAPVGDLVFSVAFLISYLSQVTVLTPGDIIATGTPSGIGLYRDPQLFMKAGDLVEVDIQGIGTLRNRVEDEA